MHAKKYFPPHYLFCGTLRFTWNYHVIYSCLTKAIQEGLPLEIGKSNQLFKFPMERKGRQSRTYPKCVFEHIHEYNQNILRIEIMERVKIMNS